MSDAWQAALAAEHAAVYGYGIVGPRVPAAERSLARRCEDQHQRLRDQTVAALAAGGHAPVPPEPSYPMPFAVVDAASARRFALRLETDAAAAWRYLVAMSDPDSSVRTSASQALTDTAVRAFLWRRLISPAVPTVPFPGM